MDIIQAHWRGKQLSHGKDGNGAYITMMGTQSLLYFPVVVATNSTYKIIIEARKDSGNGVVSCNIYGNKHYGSSTLLLCCNNSMWETYNVEIKTESFPKNLPFVFRLWRSPKGTGNLSIRHIIVELVEAKPELVEAKPELVEAKPELVEAKPELVEAKPELVEAKPELVEAKPELVDKQLLNTYVKMLNFDDNNKQKVLYLPLNNDMVQQTGMEDAFVANGFSVCSFDHRRYSLKAKTSIDAALQYLVDMVKPDWIHAQLQFCNYLSPTAIANIKKDYPSTFFTIWTGDIRSEIDKNFASFVPFVDYALLSNMGQISNYEAVCGNHGNVKYWQNGYDPKLFYRETDEIRNEYQQQFKHDICLCANYIPMFPGSKDRLIISEILQKKYNDRFALYGSGWSDFVSGTRPRSHFFEQQKIYNGSKVILSINNFNDVEMYFSSRQLITMASGTATISSYIPGLERYFQNRVHTAWFTTAEECVELVDYYLAHPEEAEKMGKAGADILQKQHTYASRVKELYNQLDINNVKQQTKQIESQDKMTVVEAIPELDEIKLELELPPKLINEQLLKKYIKIINFDDNKQRVLYMPLNNDIIQQTGMEDAFVANDFSVCSFDCYRYNQETNIPVDNILRMLVDEIKPDWIHIQLQFCKFLSPKTITDIKEHYPKTFITIWTGDIRTEIDDIFASFVPFVDYSLISSVGQLSAYSQFDNSNNMRYWQIGYDPKFFYRETDEVRNEYQQKFKHDICLCASHFSFYPDGEERLAIAKALRQKFGERFGLYGWNWSDEIGSYGLLNFFEQQKIYNGSKILISINNFNNIKMYFSSRQLITMASGTATISRYIPGLEQYFQNYIHTAWFTTTEECIDLVDYYLSHPEEAEKMGKAGADIVRKQHTYASRVKELCTYMGVKLIPIQKYKTKINVSIKEPEISIVISTYNRLKSLQNVIERTLESGSEVDIEIIVNDGGSTDGTREWLITTSQIDKRIKPILSDVLEGITVAYNRGFRAARGKFVTWLSDDTVPVGTAIADLVQFMKKLNSTDAAGLPVCREIDHYFISKINGFLSASIACVYRSTLEKMDYWNIDYPYYAQDNEFCARLLRCGGHIFECNAKINHQRVRDQLRTNNAQKFTEIGGSDKFYLMCANNYGQKAYYMYPAILICDDITNIEFVSKYINNFKKIFKNIIIHAVDSPMLVELCEICGTIEIVQKTDIDNYDFLLTKDGFCYRDTMKPVIKPCLKKLGFVD